MKRCSGGVVDGQKPEVIMKIVFCEHSVVNALEAAVQVYAVFESF